MMRVRPFLTSLSHPASIAAVALLLLNDHVLKSTWPSWTTGKLSDVAGLVFFPLLLAALIELLPQRDLTQRRVLAACIAATAVVFTSVELIPLAANAYQVTMGALQWPLRLVFDSTAQFSAVVTTPDPSDLLTLPALAISWWIAARALSKSSPRGGSSTLPQPADRAYNMSTDPNS